MALPIVFLLLLSGRGKEEHEGGKSSLFVEQHRTSLHYSITLATWQKPRGTPSLLLPRKSVQPPSF